jgi:hypothetical protein
VLDVTPGRDAHDYRLSFELLLVGFLESNATRGPIPMLHSDPLMRRRARWRNGHIRARAGFYLRNFAPQTEFSLREFERTLRVHLGQRRRQSGRRTDEVSR